MSYQIAHKHRKWARYFDFKSVTGATHENHFRPVSISKIILFVALIVCGKTHVNPTKWNLSHLTFVLNLSHSTLVWDLGFENKQFWLTSLNESDRFHLICSANDGYEVKLIPLGFIRKDSDENRFPVGFRWKDWRVHSSSKRWRWKMTWRGKTTSNLEVSRLGVV